MKKIYIFTSYKKFSAGWAGEDLTEAKYLEKDKILSAYIYGLNFVSAEQPMLCCRKC
jgi:hypothetical protein